MRKYITTLIYFILFAAVFYVVVLFFWGRYMPFTFQPNLQYKLGTYGHMFSRVKEAKQTKNVDVLFLGSSHTYRGFDTRIFKAHAISTFNLGSSAQTPIQTKLLLEKYLDQINPKTIIYEVYPEIFSIDGVESALDIIANDRKDIQSVKMALDLNHIKVYNALLYGFERQLLNKDAEFIEALKKGNDNYISGGYVEKEISFFKNKKQNTKKWKLSKEQLSSFNEIVDLVKRKNSRLILVYAPITSALYNSYSNNKMVDSLMRTYSTYYNFNDIMQLDDSLHFYDPHHLNQNGVQLFNDQLIKLLKLN